ncbi:hypothetical protein NIA69_07415 [Gemmiger formicilis]|nr:hypothetical protein [Gemmiger formicilis]
MASRDTRLLKAQLDALHALPGNCWFVNYLRCHDDIGWGLDEAAENRFDIDPQKHKEYLYHFYAGDFPEAGQRASCTTTTLPPAMPAAAAPPPACAAWSRRWNRAM